MRKFTNDSVNYLFSIETIISKDKMQTKAYQVMRGKYFPTRISLFNYKNKPSKEKRFEWNLRNLAKFLFANTEMTPKEKLQILSIQRDKKPHKGISLAMLCIAEVACRELAIQLIGFSISCLEDKGTLDLIIDLWKQEDEAGLNLGALIRYRNSSDEMIQGTLNFLLKLIDKNCYLEALYMLNQGRKDGHTLAMKLINVNREKDFFYILRILVNVLSNNEGAKKNILKLLMRKSGFGFYADNHFFQCNTRNIIAVSKDKDRKFCEIFFLLDLPEIAKRIDSDQDLRNHRKGLQTAIDARTWLIEKKDELNTIKEAIGKNKDPEFKGFISSGEKIREHYDEFNTKLEAIREYLNNRQVEIKLISDVKLISYSKFEEIENQLHYTQISLDQWALQAVRPAESSKTLEADYRDYFEYAFPRLWASLKKTVYSEMHRNEMEYFCKAVYEITTLQFNFLESRLRFIDKKEPKSDSFIRECATHLFLGIGLQKQYHAGSEHTETLFWKFMLQLSQHVEKKSAGTLNEEAIPEFKKRNDTFENISSFVMQALENHNEIAREENYCAFIEAIKWLCLTDENIPHMGNLLSIKNIIDTLIIEKDKTEGNKIKALLESLLKAQTKAEFTKQLMEISRDENISILKTLVKEYDQVTVVTVAARITQCSKMFYKISKIIQLSKDPQLYAFYKSRKKRKKECSDKGAESHFLNTL